MKNDQTFTELTKTAGISRESVLLGLKDLKDVISRNKNTKRYHLNSETKSKVLVEFRKRGIWAADIEAHMQSLREDATPFVTGFNLIRYGLKDISSLTFEQNLPNLTALEKIECAELIKHCNTIIRRTFEVLEEINFEQTLTLKTALDLTNNTAVGDEYKYITTKLNNKQFKQALRISNKIIHHLPKNKLVISKKLKN